jgi:hypothetical protein
VYEVLRPLHLAVRDFSIWKAFLVFRSWVGLDWIRGYGVAVVATVVTVTVVSAA